MELERIDAGQLRTLLNQGTVEFAFKKLGGTLRTAVGTTELSNVPVESHPKGVRPSPPSVVTFFDIQKQAWRRVSTQMEMFIALK